ncbi:hypothetical protein HYV12_03280 [Candidatus Dojkabacteria bacterium]|nr:hypothetical protein [Candidatus Dojkabacteria bacterium]
MTEGQKWPESPEELRALAKEILQNAEDSSRGVFTYTYDIGDPKAITISVTADSRVSLILFIGSLEAEIAQRDFYSHSSGLDEKNTYWTTITPKN